MDMCVFGFGKGLGKFGVELVEGNRKKRFLASAGLQLALQR